MFVLTPIIVVSNADGSVPTTCSVIGENLDHGGPDTPLAVLPQVANAIQFLANQDVEAQGFTVTKIQVTGGPSVEYLPATDEFRVHQGLATPWSREKTIDGYLAGLVAADLIEAA